MLKRKMTLMMAAGTLALLVGCSSAPKMGGGGGSEQAKVEAAPEPKRTLVDYEVKQGDTLWELAREYDTTISEIKTVNNLDSDIIFAGKKIKLPVMKVLEPGETAYTEASSEPIVDLAPEPAPAPALIPQPLVPDYGGDEPVVAPIEP